MRWLAIALMGMALAACGSAPKKPAPAPGAIVPGTAGADAGAGGKPCKVYAPAQEDPSKRGDYVSGGLYAPGVRDTTPDYVPDVDCIAEPVVAHEPRSAVGNRSPYQVLGKQYHVLDKVDGFVETGTASYYGAKFHGRRTSNLEVYDMYAFTAAHKSLPLPSFARVTNLDNGQSVVVRVNDRGPFHEGRVIDLSYAAAVKLGITQRGTGRVEVRALTPDGAGTRLAANRPSTPPPAAAATPMDELVGRLPAADAARASSAASTVDAARTAAPAAGHRYDVAAASQRKPGAEGFDDWMQARGVRVATGKPAAPGRAAAPATPAPAVASGHAVQDRLVLVQLQIASFASRENADRALAQLSAAGIACTISDIVSNGRRLWRLRAGAPDTDSADALARRIAGLGFGRPQFVNE